MRYKKKRGYRIIGRKKKRRSLRRYGSSRGGYRL